jgi:hypothetical protein
VFFPPLQLLLRVSQVSHNVGHIPSKFILALYILAPSSPTRTQVNPLHPNVPSTTRYAADPKVSPLHLETSLVSMVCARTRPSSPCFICTTSMDASTPKSFQILRPPLMTTDLPKYAEMVRLCASFWAARRTYLPGMLEILMQWRATYRGLNDIYGVDHY